MNIIGPVPNYINDYNNKDIKLLSKDLNNTDKRVSFENWLINNFSTQSKKTTEYDWQVIKLLATQALADGSSSADDTRHEDLLIARLISQAMPLYTKGQKTATVSSLQKPTQGADVLEGLTSSTLHQNLPLTSNIVMKRMIEEAGSFDKLMTQAIKENKLNLIVFIIKQRPQEFKNFILKQNEQGETALHSVIKKSNVALSNLIIMNAPEAISIQDNQGDTPLHQAANMISDVNWIGSSLTERMFQVTPEAVKIQNNKGETPLLLVVEKHESHIAKAMIKAVPGAAGIADKKGTTPLHSAVSYGNKDLCEALIEAAPETATMLNEEAETPYSLAKMYRTDNYREIAQLIKKHFTSEDLELQKTYAKRKALGHSWDIAGISPLVNAKTNEILGSVTLTGFLPFHWFHLMKKQLEGFTKSYPDLLSPIQLNLMKQVFDLGANSTSYKYEDKVNRIKAGLPSVLNSGFFKPPHAVTLLIWGDQLIICNRGWATRRPIEVYHFDSQSIDINLLKEIDRIRNNGSDEEYKKLFYEILPNKLKFTQTDMDRKLEEACPLPLQTVGNCSFAAPIVSLFSFMALAELRGVNEDGTLGKPDAGEYQSRYGEKMQKGISTFQTWLSDLQMEILENNISPLESQKQDNELILKTLRNAYLLPLDERNSMKLDELVEKHLATLTPLQRLRTNCDLKFWEFVFRSPIPGKRPTVQGLQTLL